MMMMVVVRGQDVEEEQVGLEFTRVGLGEKASKTEKRDVQSVGQHSIAFKQ